MNWKIWTLVVIALPILGSSALGDKIKESASSDKASEAKIIKIDEAPQDGAILGSVIAPNAEVSICASNDKKIIKGTVNEDGEFFINGFEDGTYTVTITSSYGDELKISSFEDVTVVAGEVTALGTVDLEHRE